jgi:hypothetical protein
VAPEQQTDRALSEETAIKVALAEYSGLQAQLGNHITAQYSLVGIALTAFGVVTGLALAKGATVGSFW